MTLRLTRLARLTLHPRYAYACCVAMSLASPIAAQDTPWLDPLRVAAWHVAGEGRGLPAADASSVYFLSRRHEVIAVAARSGRVRWRAVTGEQGESTAGQRAMVAGPVVVVGDDALVAFDRATGVRRWRFVPDDGGYAVGSYLGAAAAGVVYAGGRGGMLYAVDAETGRARWSAMVVDDAVLSIVFDPVPHGDLVVTSFTLFTTPNRGGVVAFDARTGRARWRADFTPPPEPQRHFNAGGAPVVTEQFVLATRGDGVIHAFDRRSGALAWTLPRVEGGILPFTQDSRPLLVTGRLLVAGSTTGVVVAYDLVSRREQWRYNGQLGSVAFAIAGDERGVYVPYVGGRLVALTVGTGAERWRIGDAMLGFVWPPLVHADRVYVAGSGAGFYALRR